MSPRFLGSICKNRQDDETLMSRSEDAPSRINELAKVSNAVCTSEKQQMPEPDRRRDRRFVMSHPATLRFRKGASTDIAAVTINVSTRGVYLQAEMQILEGSEVEVRIAVPTRAQ